MRATDTSWYITTRRRLRPQSTLNCKRNNFHYNWPSLTPKGPNVRTADKPVLVTVTWAHTIFRFFETFCEDASHRKLRGKKKSYFLDLQIKSYGCLKFLGEVWAGRACAGANEEELTACGKTWGQRSRKEGVGGLDKGGPAQERLATASRPWPVMLLLLM
jgi:hypothetical protein